MSVSNASISPASVTRADASWNHGLVRAGGQQARLDPLTAVADVLVVQLRPDLQLCAAGLGRALVHAMDGCVADCQRPAHKVELVGGLDRAGVLRQLASVDDLDAAAGQRR